MREYLHIDDRIYAIVEDLSIGKCKSKTFYINDDYGFFIKVRIESL